MKKTIASLLTLLMTVFFVTPISANSKNDTDNAVSVPVKVEATLTNSETGQKQTLTLNSFDDVKLISETDNEQTYVASGEVYVDLRNGPFHPQLMDSEGGSNSDFGVRAYVTVYFTLRNWDQEINISKFTGGWQQPANTPIVYTINHKAVLRQYFTSGKVYTAYPNQYTFNYSIPWGWVKRIEGQYGPNVRTGADIVDRREPSIKNHIDLSFTF